MKLQKLEQLPTFKDQLAIVCYPEMIKTAEGRIVFEALKQSFQSHKLSGQLDYLSHKYCLIKLNRTAIIKTKRK